MVTALEQLLLRKAGLVLKYHLGNANKAYVGKLVSIRGRSCIFKKRDKTLFECTSLGAGQSWEQFFSKESLK